MSLLCFSYYLNADDSKVCVSILDFPSGFLTRWSIGFLDISSWILHGYITRNVSEMECTTASPSPPLFHPSYPTWAVDQVRNLDVILNACSFPSRPLSRVAPVLPGFAFFSILTQSTPLPLAPLGPPCLQHRSLLCFLTEVPAFSCAPTRPFSIKQPTNLFKR